MEIYQHFRKEEQPFIDNVVSWKEEVGRSFTRKLTDFLDPRERMIFQSIIGQDEDFVWKAYGGPDHAERQRMILAPFYEEIEEKDFEVTLLEASYPSKFVTLEHRDVLGAFMSLGVVRKKLGDLIVTEDKIQILVASEIADYVKMNLTGVKKAGIQFAEKPIDNLLPSEEEWLQKDGTVSSLRLDVVLKEIYTLSRQKAVQFIEKGQIKVNYRTVESSSFELREGDLISFRGKGRSLLTSVHGQTKKEKWRVSYAKLK
ncbi:RNA-binding protein S4 [Pontibacillus halophilus JSM 076056 = DSM 19796]|uniref:RNA-binding protein S4 n=1 Tax=Pontibacillus halophilus JSM 076056 = DSM 19796 TaxID=1385510 RepID=A0A0A5GJ12_9BACI|nr:RNA-binding protein [Pontibacillus halophilus]KGX93246.1 RNA-binding protein S4 [Pontibacillus halophilus JSM 076056 = DSM 19796]